MPGVDGSFPSLPVCLQVAHSNFCTKTFSSENFLWIKSFGFFNFRLFLFCSWDRSLSWCLEVQKRDGFADLPLLWGPALRHQGLMCQSGDHFHGFQFWYNLLKLRRAVWVQSSTFVKHCTLDIGAWRNFSFGQAVPNTLFVLSSPPGRSACYSPQQKNRLHAGEWSSVQVAHLPTLCIFFPALLFPWSRTERK